MNPINILFLIYDLERGGPELRLLDFARHFPSDIKMHICVTSKNVSLLPEFLKLNANVKVVPVFKGYLELNKAWKIYKYVKTNRISIINSFGLKELFLSFAIKAFSGWKIKTVYHSVELLHHYGSSQKNLLRFLLKTTKAILCNSEQSMKFIKGFSVPEDKIAVIKNGIDTNCFRRSLHNSQDLKTKYGLRKNEFVLGTIANFRDEKNYPFLIKAFRNLLQRHANLRLICVGGGYLLDEIKEVSRSYGLENNLIFTGYSKDVAEYLSLMNIFVLCSTRESFPNVLLQAMGMEIPIIASNVGGCAEIVDHLKNGILYPSNHLGRFIEAVEILIEDRSFASKLAANARRTVVKKFSLNRMIEEYKAFFRALSERQNDKSG